MDFLYDLAHLYYSWLNRIRYGKSVAIQEIRDLLPQLKVVRITIDSHVERELAKLPWYKESSLLSDKATAETLDFKYDEETFWNDCQTGSTLYTARIRQKGEKVFIKMVNDQIMEKQQTNGQPVGNYGIVINLEGVFRQ